jgi:predicted transcriptional regulator
MARPRSEQPTPGELEVLRILWRRGPSTVRDVMQALNGDRPRAYTSVMSLLNVMTEKGLVRRRPRGRAFVYAARAEESSTLGRMVGDLMERAFEGSAHQLVLHALERTDIDPQELDRIQALIDQHRRQNREVQP